MKKLLTLAIPLLISLAAQAQESTPAPIAAAGTLIEASTTETIKGVGGWSEVKHTFAKGDRVSLSFQAGKQLEMVTVTQGPRKELAKKKATKSGDLQFVVPADGEVVIRFVNDRGGQNDVKYELRKL